MTWWTGRAIGIDTETDGVDPTDARIITCATVVMDGRDNDANEIMVQPERDIPEGASKIHGITTEQAREHGMPREMAIASIAATLATFAGPECPVVGHNVGGYDLTVLDRELRRTGVGHLEIEDNVFAQIGQVRLWIGAQLATVFPVIDTLVLDKAVDKYRRGRRQLAPTAQHYGAPMAEGSAHGATADVIASLRIAIAIANRYAAGAIGAMSLAELHAAQIRWAGEQADGLREYFRKSGTGDPAGVSGEWPLRSLADGEVIETVSTTV